MDMSLALSLPAGQKLLCWGATALGSQTHGAHRQPWDKASLGVRLQGAKAQTKARVLGGGGGVEQ